MKTYSIIPARSGSKGLLGKNVMFIAGRPLICWTIQAAIESRCFERVIVSTDCPEIAELAKDSGAEVPFLRPHQLARDDSRIIDVVSHLSAKLGFSRDDRFCLLQPTSPLREASDIIASRQLLSKAHVKSVVSVVRFKMAAEWLMGLREDRRLALPEPSMTPSNRQECEPHYYPNGAIYWCDVGAMEESGGLLASPVAAYEMEYWKSIDVDNLTDFEVAEYFLKKRIKACQD